MTQEEKDLLLTDLCGRLPHGVICRFTDTFDGCEVDNVLHPDDITDMFRHRSHCDSRIDVRPYLRPMSSMTEEEREELKELTAADVLTNNGFGYENLRGMCFGMMYIDCQELIDWLNAHHFDYRGLIPKDLALSTEIYNPYKD